MGKGEKLKKAMSKANPMAIYNEEVSSKIFLNDNKKEHVEVRRGLRKIFLKKKGKNV